MTSPTARFPLGRIVATPGALAALASDLWELSSLLRRPQSGDWGEVDAADCHENELSVDLGYRILSAYMTRTSVKVWVITEVDRSATTLLLPQDY